MLFSFIKYFAIPNYILLRILYLIFLKTIPNLAYYCSVYFNVAFNGDKITNIIDRKYNKYNSALFLFV